MTKFLEDAFDLVVEVFQSIANRANVSIKVVVLIAVGLLFCMVAFCQDRTIMLPDRYDSTKDKCTTVEYTTNPGQRQITHSKMCTCNRTQFELDWLAINQTPYLPSSDGLYYSAKVGLWADTLTIDPAVTKFIKIGDEVYEVKTVHSIEKVQPVEIMPWWRSINTGSEVSPTSHLINSPDRVLTVTQTGEINWTETEDAEKVIAEEVRKNGASNNPKTAQIK
jgi:hypothetical protein